MKRISILLSLVWLLTVSCNSSYDSVSSKSSPSHNESMAQDAYMSAEMQLSSTEKSKEQGPMSPIAKDVPIEQQLIKTGDVSLIVADYKATRPKLLAFVKQAKGYVSSDSEENSSYRTGARLQLRVPQQNFDTLLTQIVGLATMVENKSISVQDVTAEFVDIKARLRTKREVEQRYVEILKQAKNVKEILEVESHLRQLREEIEAKEGRLKYLRSQVGYSTIQLSVYQRHTESVYEPSFFGEIGTAISGGWKGIQTFVIGLVYIWPFLLIFALVFWFIRRKVKQRKAHKE